MTIFKEAEILGWALTRFREETGLQADILDLERPLDERKTARADAIICINIDNKKFKFIVEIKNVIDREAMLYQVNNQLIHLQQMSATAKTRTAPTKTKQRAPGILIAPHVTPQMAQRCREIGLPFMDTAGNAFLNEEGLFILITGQKPDRTAFPPTKVLRAFDRTGLKVVFALLAEPTWLGATYREIAKAAGVALGTVGWVLTDLRDHGFLIEDHKGNRRWLDRARAIETWVTNYPLRLRKQLHPRRFRAKEEDWWKHVQPEAYGGCWGGEVAAAKLMGELAPKTVTVYLPEDRKAFLTANRLRADPEGPIEVLDAFWNLPKNTTYPPELAAPLLVFADLQYIGDPRTMEQAERIHERYLA